MAKRCMFNREIRRMALIRKYAEQRSAIKETIRSPQSTEAEKRDAQRRLQLLPRDSSPSRYRNRCRLTGRAQGFYRKFGLSRNKLREAAMRGDIPGLRKASW